MTAETIRAGIAGVIAGLLVFLAFLALPWVLAAEVGLLR